MLCDSTLSSSPAQAMTCRAITANSGLNSRVMSLAWGGSRLAMRTVEYPQYVPSSNTVAGFTSDTTECEAHLRTCGLGHSVQYPLHNDIMPDQRQSCMILHNSWDHPSVESIQESSSTVPSWGFPFKMTECCLNTSISYFRLAYRYLSHKHFLKKEIQGCFRHWAAVALFSGSSSNMVTRNELNCTASSRGHSYLSSRISNKLHDFSLEMCRSCPAK
ncbi:hypothetical protein F7725_016568, partial [Dissostichus mawsoni]